MSTPFNKTHDTTNQVADKIHDVVDKAAAGIATAEEKVRCQASQAADRVRDGAQYAQDKSADVIHSVASYVRENPLTAIGIAFVAGSIISSLTRRH